LVFPGGSPPASTDQNPANICYSNPGTFDVTLITDNAFGIDTLTLTGFITVYPTPPFPTITQNGYTLTSSPASAYQWQLNTIDIAGATNQSYTALQSGLYTVIISDVNGCVNSANKDVLITGIDDMINEASVSIYPNPSSGNFIVEITGQTGREVAIDVLNTLGQKVFSSSESRSAGAALYLRKEIDMNEKSEMMCGVYFIEVRTQDTFIRKKIIVVK